MNELKTYISQNFYLPDNDLDKICNFIESEPEIKKMIYELPDIVKNEIEPIKGAQINFYPEFQEEDLRPEVQFIADVEPRESLDISYKIIDKLQERYSIDIRYKVLVYVMKYFNL